jgi:hypothetical protein
MGDYKNYKLSVSIFVLAHMQVKRNKKRKKGKKTTTQKPSYLTVPLFERWLATTPTVYSNLKAYKLLVCEK